MTAMTAVPAWQSRVALHVSAPLQKSPSSQVPSFATLSQESVLSLHESSVQPTPSSQVTAVPVWHEHMSGLQISIPVQNRPSLHSASVKHKRTHP